MAPQLGCEIDFLNSKQVYKSRDESMKCMQIGRNINILMTH